MCGSVFVAPAVPRKLFRVQGFLGSAQTFFLGQIQKYTFWNILYLLYSFVSAIGRV
jgi:hypothetical protein